MMGKIEDPFGLSAQQNIPINFAFASSRTIALPELEINGQGMKSQAKPQKVRALHIAILQLQGLKDSEGPAIVSYISQKETYSVGNRRTPSPQHS